MTIVSLVSLELKMQYEGLALIKHAYGAYTIMQVLILLCEIGGRFTT